MNAESSIRCPQCGSEIDVNEVLYHQLEEQLLKKYEKERAKKEQEYQLELKEINAQKQSLEKERNELTQTVDTTVQARLKEGKLEIEKRIKKQLSEENSDLIKDLKEEIEEKSKQVKELNKAKADIEKLKREKEGLREEIEFEKSKEYGELLNGEKIKIRKQVDEENALKIKQKEKVIEDLTTQLGEAKRKAEQGSMQLQGEVQELELENILKELFIYDDIAEIKKGQRGGDTIQTVKTQQGIACGKIYYESKRTKNFDDNWLQKLRDDNLVAKADILVLVTETMPDGNDKFFYKDGVWICSLWELKGLALSSDTVCCKCTHLQ